MNKLLDKIVIAFRWIISQPLGRYGLTFIAGMALVLMVQCSVARAGEVMIGYDLRFNDWTVEVCNSGTCAGYDVTDNLYYLARQSEDGGLRVSGGIGYQPHTDSIVGRVVGSASGDETTGELWAKGLLFENYVEGSYGVGFRYIEDNDPAPVAPVVTPPKKPHHEDRRWHHEG